MKIKYSFETVGMDDEFILVPVGHSAKQIQGVIRTNDSGNKIIQMMMQGMDEGEVVNLLAEEYENDRESLAEYVRLVVSVLKDNHIID